MNPLAWIKQKQADTKAEAAASADSQPASQTVAGDRGIPSVNTKRRTPLMTKLLRGLLLLAGLAMVASGCYTVYRKFSTHSNGTNDAPAAQQTNVVPDEIHNTAPLDLGADAVPALPDQASGNAASAPVASSGTTVAVPAVTSSDSTAPIAVVRSGGGRNEAGQANGAPDASGAASTDGRMKRGMVYGGGDDDSPSMLNAAGLSAIAGANGALGGGNQGVQSGSANSLGNMLNSTRTEIAVASKMPDDNFILSGGTYIDCTANAAVDTTQPGMLNCYGDHDVWSANGKVVLLDRGTKYRIEYQRGLQQGQSRIFFLASEATTPAPYSVRVSLDSPINDSLGRAGVDGYVNTHFWERFGGALMVGWIGDFGQALANKTAQSSSGFSFTQTTNSGSDAASKALDATVNIAPSLVHNQAAHLKIYVARDLDFRKVYALSSTQ